MGDVFIAMGGGGLDTDECTATRAQVLSGYTAGVHGEEAPAPGGMPNNGAWGSSLGINGDIVIPEGYHNGQGHIRQSVVTMGGQTITLGASQQVVSCNGKYMTGDVTVNSVANLAAENIKKDVVVGGIKGSCNWIIKLKNTYQKANINVAIPNHDPNSIPSIPLYTFTIPGTEKYNALVGMAVTVLTAMFGQFWYLFAGYLLLNLIDWLTGWYKARKLHKESSGAGLWGIVKKAGYWVIILAAFLIPTMFISLGRDLLGVNLSFLLLFGWLTLANLLVNEFRSILENLVECGYEAPDFLIRGLAVTEKLLSAKTDDLKAEE